MARASQAEKDAALALYEALDALEAAARKCSELDLKAVIHYGTNTHSMRLLPFDALVNIHLQSVTCKPAAAIELIEVQR